MVVHIDFIIICIFLFLFYIIKWVLSIFKDNLFAFNQFMTL